MSKGSAGGFSIQKGIQLFKEVAVLNMREAAGDAALDKLWADTFKDDTGIDAGNSSGYTHDSGSQEVDKLTSGLKVSETAATAFENNISNTEPAIKKGSGTLFAAPSAFAAASCAFWIKKTGSPTGTVKIRLYASSTQDLNGTPTGAVLAETTLDVSTLTTSIAKMEFTFDAPYTVTSGVYYCLVIESDTYVGDGSNYIVISRYNGNQNAAHGSVYKNASAWVSTSDDVKFELSATVGASAVLQSIRALDLAEDVTEVIAFAEVTGGSISLTEISTDDGATWTTVTLDTIASVPAGNQIKMRITFTGSLQYWGVAA